MTLWLGCAPRSNAILCCGCGWPVVHADAPCAGEHASLTLLTALLWRLRCCVFSELGEPVGTSEADLRQRWIGRTRLACPVRHDAGAKHCSGTRVS